MSSFSVSFPGIGIHDIPVHRKAFDIFGLDVYWYGMIIAFGVILSLFLAVRHCQKYGITKDEVYASFLAIVPLSIIFARMYYVIFSWHLYSDNLLKIFDTRLGGMAFYGGVIGGIIGFVIVCKYYHKKLANWLDFFVIYLPLGQAIGRWGNFVNQEAFGTNTTLPWGMISEGTRGYLQSLHNPLFNPDLPVHPTFLYEFIGNMIIFIVLLSIRRRSNFNYENVAWYLLLYGTLRFFVESIRTDSLYWGDFRVSMLLSLIMFVVGLAYLVYIYTRKEDKVPACIRKDWFAVTSATKTVQLADNEVSNEKEVTDVTGDTTDEFLSSKEEHHQ